MENIKLHLHLTDRTTTVTVHPTLYHLLSIALTGNLNARASVVEWLSVEVTRKLGNVPIGTHGFIGKYVTDIIVSRIVDSNLYTQYEKLQYPDDGK